MFVGYLVEIVVTIMLYAYWLLPALMELIVYYDFFKIEKDLSKSIKKYLIANTIISILHLFSVIYVHIKLGILFFVNMDGTLLFQKVQKIEEIPKVILFILPIISIIIFICMLLKIKKLKKKEENPNV